MEAYIQNVIFLLIFLIFKGLHFSGLYILECMISYSLRCQLGFWFVMFLILFLILIVFLSSYLVITSHTLRNHALSSLQSCSHHLLILSSSCFKDLPSLVLLTFPRCFFTFSIPSKTSLKNSSKTFYSSVFLFSN